MIDEIRAYFNATAKAENSDLRANDKPTTDEIANTIIEDTFFLEIGSMNTRLLDSTIESSIDVNLNIYKSGNREAIDNYDKGYCEAISIQARAMYKAYINQQAFIKNVTSSGIDIETINNNDNMYKFSIQFTVTIDYKHTI